ncbi:MAG TPA: Gfo/Idh/MocA family oxidoreductase [Candidatus Hydrogenedentes bacterium]|nr:Gfo/Idh/MocA family oxidoreductase [Candidatus Hydrogenedentota bacterium]HRK33132.1 Gfo/Idh/MocA family oxidoreductase [Candidatus Hydrogenedentota bacterium]
MQPISRRSFIQTSGALAATHTILGSAFAATGEKVRHAVIGTGGQGGNHARVFSSMEDCEVVAIADVHAERRDQIAKALSEKAPCKAYEDFRELLADKSIHSVSIGTPDHWHTPVALAALKAGMHVYVEKPCCHNMKEGVLLAEAQKKTGLCVQHGTQYRSTPSTKEAVQMLRDGVIGKVRVAKAINHQFRPSIGRKPDSEPPAGVNYDMWLGPAPVRPFSENRFHYNWHWHWDYGTGDIGNDGVHQIDVARWGLGVGLPKAVSASGGQLFYDDDHETPDTQVVTYEYDECYLIYEMRLWTEYLLEGHDNGVVYYGDKGTIEVGRHGTTVKLHKEEPKLFGSGPDLSANVRNFLDCVKENDPSKLNAPISEGAISSQLSLLGNVATRVGRRLVLDTEKVECIGDDEANKLFTRDYRKGYELVEV